MRYSRAVLCRAAGLGLDEQLWCGAGCLKKRRSDVMAMLDCRPACLSCQGGWDEVHINELHHIACDTCQGDRKH